MTDLQAKLERFETLAVRADYQAGNGWVETRDIFTARYALSRVGRRRTQSYCDK